MIKRLLFPSLFLVAALIGLAPGPVSRPTNPNVIRVYNVAAYGASASNNAATNTTALQAAVDAADATGGGLVYVPDGVYDNNGIVVGSGNTSGNGRSSNVSIVGESQTNTVLKYKGATPGVAVDFNKNKYASIKNITILNGTGARAATEGLRTAGPTFGTNSNGNVIESVSISGFHYGWHTSSNSGGSSGNTSSEITAINLNLTNCDSGMRNDDFNALNFVLINLAIGGNTIGVEMNTSGVFVRGGSSGANTTDFQIRNSGPNAINDFRSEVAGTFLDISTSTERSTMFMSNNNVEGLTGTDAITAQYCRLDLHGGEYGGKIHIGTGVDVAMTGTKVVDSYPFYYVSNVADGAHYALTQCSYGAPAAWVAAPDVIGVIKGTAKRDLGSVSVDGLSSQWVTGAVTKTANYTMTAADATILADATAGAMTVTLPPATSTQTVRVKKIDSSGNAVTVSRAGSDTIEGATTVSLATQYASQILQADATATWYKFTPTAGGGTIASTSNLLQGDGAGNASSAGFAASDVARLSQANTFTAANINSTSGAASVPAMKYSGVPFAGTGTTSFPLVYLNDSTATASTTLKTAGTYLGVNGHGTSDLANFMLDGVSEYNFSSSGTFRLRNVIGGSLMYIYTDGASAMADTTANRNIEINGSVSKGINSRRGYYVGWANGDPAATAPESKLTDPGPGIVQVTNTLQYTGVTFANLPTAAAGIQAYITDGLAASCGDTTCTTWGTTVTAGGGALKLLVWYNGTNWTLIGK